jgi:four helix bundle protein
MRIFFDHEKLNVYQEALRFYAWCEPILERLPKSADVRDQLDRARTSVVLNIPEGNGKFTPADRCRFFDNSRGSALESAGCLDLIFIKKVISEQEMEDGKAILQAIVSMLVGLIRSNSPDRLHEEPVEYRVRD